MAVYLDFEKEIKELEIKIEELKKFSQEKGIDLSSEVEKLQNNLKDEMEKVYKNLTAWQKTQVARHPERPFTLDYIETLCKDFEELHGDRLFKDDHAIVGGIGKIDGQSFVIIGHQKGREMQSHLYRNFGMANPEGYRKALRLMRLAERFNLPVLTLIDTAGAYPGLEAEERGQGEAIARNLMEMAGLNTKIIAVIIGEGGSGGALALGVADKVYILENSIYSVISPEGCAAILYNDASKAPEAAENLKVDSSSLLKAGIVDAVISEAVGGAHRDYKLTADNLKKQVFAGLAELDGLSNEELKELRYEKFRKFGAYTE